MIILDTNILSEPLKRVPSPIVVTWLSKQQIDTMYLTAINMAEIWAGLAMMPPGKRREALTAGTDRVCRQFIGERILPFDIRAARAYAEILAEGKDKGRPLPTADAQIAAIAKANRFAVATRDVEPFRAAGVDVVNPWAAE